MNFWKNLVMLLLQITHPWTFPTDRYGKCHKNLMQTRLELGLSEKDRKWSQFRVILYHSYIWRLKTAHRKSSRLTVRNVSKPRVKYDKNERCWSVNSIMRSRLQKFAWFHRRETLSNVKFNLISPQIETGPHYFHNLNMPHSHILEYYLFKLFLQK